MAVIAVLLLVVLGLCLRGIGQEKEKEKRLLASLEENYGSENRRQWKEGELKRISRYAAHRTREESIDGQTWNDLHMDDIFKQMAYTASSLGDDYLYYLLKHPEKDGQKLKEREKKIAYLQENSSGRLRVQLLFTRLGRMNKYSLSDYLDHLMELSPKSNSRHYIVLALMAAALALTAVQAPAGLIALFLLLFYNIFTYFQEKRENEPYLASIGYLLRLFDFGEQIGEALPEEWQEEKRNISRITGSFRRFRRQAFWLMPSGSTLGEGLEVVLSYLRMCFHPDIIKFNHMITQIRGHGEEIWQLYELLGEWDSCTAIAWYRAFLPVYCIPQVEEKLPGEAELVLEEVYHPLIPSAVPNSLRMKKNILLTGSNASGKSTFLRTVGVNVLLAQSIHTCAAKQVMMPPLRLYTSMNVTDSLTAQESYYMAEIRAIKRILDSTGKPGKVICMIDEVLRGTNTVERIAASSQILEALSEAGVLCLAATHDIELTQLVAEEYENYHFEETLEQSDVQFTYTLKPGRTKSHNAIDLLERMGYPPKLVSRARELAEQMMGQE
jgi:hypothetical protein